MQQNALDLALLESHRETGDYDKIAAMLPDGWQALPEFEDEAIRLRLLIAEISGRGGRIEEMEAALARSFTPEAIAGIRISPDGLNSDIHGTAEYRAHLVTVMAKRAVAAVLESGQRQ